MHQKALEIHERIGDEPGVAWAYGNLADAYQEMGDVGQALTYYHKALEIKERISDWIGAADNYFNLGRLYRDQGELERARAQFEKAKVLYEMVGASRGAQRAARALRGV